MVRRQTLRTKYREPQTANSSWRPHRSIFDPSWRDQNVQGHSGKILVGDIATFIACCDSCQRIKAEHQKPAGLLQPNKIPEWKWDEIGMDFIVGLPRSRHGNDAIWVITDRLTKVAHFIPVKTTHTTQKLAKLYLSRIVCLHGIPKTIISDRGTQFISAFWDHLQ